MLTDETVALEIQINICRGRLWERGQPEAGDNGEGLKCKYAGVAALDLNPCLLSRSLKALPRSARRNPGHWQRHRCKRLDRLDRMGLEFGNLKRGYAGNEG